MNRIFSSFVKFFFSPVIDSKRKENSVKIFERNNNQLTNDVTSISIFAQCSISLNSMFQTIQFPTGITNLNTWIENQEFYRSDLSLTNLLDQHEHWYIHATNINRLIFFLHLSNRIESSLTIFLVNNRHWSNTNLLGLYVLSLPFSSHSLFVSSYLSDLRFSLFFLLSLSLSLSLFFSDCLSYSRLYVD